MEGNSIILQFGKTANESMVHFWNAIYNTESSLAIQTKKENNKIINSKGYPRLLIIDSNPLIEKKIIDSESSKITTDQVGKEEQKELSASISNIKSHTWIDDLFFKFPLETIINITKNGNNDNLHALMEIIEEQLRKQAEDCDNLEDFIIISDFSHKDLLLETINLLADEYPKKSKTIFLIGNQDYNDQASLLYELFKDDSVHHVIPISFTCSTLPFSSTDRENGKIEQIHSLFDIPLNDAKGLLLSPILQAFITELPLFKNNSNCPILTHLSVEFGFENLDMHMDATFPNRIIDDSKNDENDISDSIIQTLKCLNPENPVYIVDTMNDGYRLLAHSIKLNLDTRSKLLTTFIAQDLMNNLDRRILNKQDPDYYDQVREGLYKLIASINPNYNDDN